MSESLINVPIQPGEFSDESEDELIQDYSISQIIFPNGYIIQKPNLKTDVVSSCRQAIIHAMNIIQENYQGSTNPEITDNGKPEYRYKNYKVTLKGLMDKFDYEFTVVNSRIE